MALSKMRRYLNSLSLQPTKRCSKMSGFVCELCWARISYGDSYRGGARKAHEHCYQRKCVEVTK